MQLDYTPGDPRLKTPVNGRYLGFTDSFTLEFLEANQQYVHPFWTPALYTYVESQYSTKPFFGFSFIIEAQGYILTEPGNRLSLVQTDEYNRFDFKIPQPVSELFREYQPPLRVLKAIEVPFAAGTNGIPANYVGRFWRVLLPPKYTNLLQGNDALWISYSGAYNANDPTGQIIENDFLAKFTAIPYPHSNTPNITI